CTEVLGRRAWFAYW
nr:immunoglobulin heavy chain junction region [Mus musculus]